MDEIFTADSNLGKLFLWMDVFPKINEDIKIKTVFSGAGK
jgi:hypothetical protein